MTGEPRGGRCLGDEHGTGEQDTGGAVPFAGHARLHGHRPAESGADTAGTSWAGRLLTASPFAGDEGEPDVRVRSAAQAVVEASPDRLHADERRLVEALASARLFAAVQAVAGHVEEQASGLVGDADSDMASPVLTAPDGRRAMPLFTGLDTLAAWRPDARPVPVRAAEAAAAALDDGCDVVLLDLGAPAAVVIRSSQLWAVAQRRAWLPAHDDPVVARALERAVSGSREVLSARLEGDEMHGPAVTRLVLQLRPGLSQPHVRAITEDVGQALAGDPEVRLRIDQLAMVLRAGERD